MTTRDRDRALAELEQSSLGEQLLTIARSDVGRTDGRSFRTGPGFNWCMYYVFDVAGRAGLETPGPRERARRGARAGTTWIAGRGRWVCSPARAQHLLTTDDDAAWLELADELRPGDVAAWRATTFPADWRGHVAFVEQVTIRRGIPPRVAGIGGNEGGRVRASELPIRAWARKLPGGLFGVARFGGEVLP